MSLLTGVDGFTRIDRLAKFLCNTFNFYESLTDEESTEDERETACDSSLDSKKIIFLDLANGSYHSSR